MESNWHHSEGETYRLIYTTHARTLATLTSVIVIQAPGLDLKFAMIDSKAQKQFQIGRLDDKAFIKDVSLFSNVNANNKQCRNASHGAL